MTLEPPPLPGERQEPQREEPHSFESISTIPSIQRDPPPRVSAAACMSCGAPLSRLDEPCLLCRRSRLITRLTLAGFLGVTVGLAALMLFLVFFKASTGTPLSLLRWPLRNLKVEAVVKPPDAQPNVKAEPQSLPSRETKAEEQPPHPQLPAPVVREVKRELPPKAELSEEERALKGDHLLQFALAERYYRGSSVPRDYARALTLYELAGQAGNVVAMMNVAVMYDKGEGAERNPEKATQWYRMAAERGNAVAQNRLAIRLLEGNGDARNAQEALNWYRRAAEQGLPDAQYNLGIMFFNGDGVARNVRLAHQWIGDAAEGGNVDALYWKGQMYASGTGVEQSYEQAQSFLRKAAEKGHPKAGLRLEEMRAVQRQRNKSESDSDSDSSTSNGNDRSSLSALESRAKGGDPDAQFKLGVMYDRGDGVARSASHAVEWYTLAARANVPAAQERLGRMLMRGEGTGRDLMAAYIWLKIAVDNGMESADGALEYVSEELSDTEQRMAGALVAKVKEKIRSGAYFRR